jgi:hypothetical protein
MEQRGCDVRFVPKGDQRRCKKILRPSWSGLALREPMAILKKVLQPNAAATTSTHDFR